MGTGLRKPHFGGLDDQCPSSAAMLSGERQVVGKNENNADIAYTDDWRVALVAKPLAEQDAFKLFNSPWYGSIFYAAARPGSAVANAPDQAVLAEPLTGGASLNALSQCETLPGQLRIARRACASIRNSNVRYSIEDALREPMLTDDLIQPGRIENAFDHGNLY